MTRLIKTTQFSRSRNVLRQYLNYSFETIIVTFKILIFSFDIFQVRFSIKILNIAWIVSFLLFFELVRRSLRSTSLSFLFIFSNDFLRQRVFSITFFAFSICIFSCSIFSKFSNSKQTIRWNVLVVSFNFEREAFSLFEFSHFEQFVIFFVNDSFFCVLSQISILYLRWAQNSNVISYLDMINTITTCWRIMLYWIYKSKSRIKFLQFWLWTRIFQRICSN